MKIKSRVNGIIIEATNATAEILKLGNGAYAKAISDSAVETEGASEAATKTTAAKKAPAKKAPAKKTPAKKAPSKAEVDELKAEAKSVGITLEDSHIDGLNKHDDDESVEVL